MGLESRDYLNTPYDGRGGGRYGGGGGGITYGLPRPTPAVKWLLIINGGVFALQLVMAGGGVDLARIFGARLTSWWQVWRYITFQFLHSTGWIFHLVLNMLGVYMLGSPLERRWGTKKFLKFYLSCGVVAGLAYVGVQAAVGGFGDMPIIGASGGVYAIVLACAVLFPQFKLIFLFFPVPIRLAAMIIFGGMIFMLLGSFAQGQYGPDFWSDVAHMGGAVAGAVWIWVLPNVSLAAEQQRIKINKGAWQRKMRQREDEEQRLDRILEKISQRGMASLTRSEKKFLRDTTQRQKQRGE